MKVISAEQVHAALNYPALVDALGEAYAGSIKMPPRQVFLLDDDEANHEWWVRWRPIDVLLL